MPAKKTSAPSTIPKSANPQGAFHAFWSGSLSFGLVNVPVNLFPATRNVGIRLRMVGPSGSFLKRTFYCPDDHAEAEPEDIVHGYELDDGSYIIVEDQELEAVEPTKSREIDLRQFVDIDEIPVCSYERGYYLTPAKDSTKAYRLLAEAMERSGRAGIATFVMRDREYLVAIFAEKGVLCAATLRFEDEIREPSYVGLPEPVTAPKKLVASLERVLDSLWKDEIAVEELADDDSRRLKAIIEKKRRSGKDLFDPDSENGAVEDEPEVEEVDLIKTIRESLHAVNGSVRTPTPATSSPTRSPAKPRTGRAKSSPHSKK